MRAPELPRLLHDFLRRRPSEEHTALRELVETQKRTNRLLQLICSVGLGFVLGLLAMQVLVRIRLF